MINKTQRNSYVHPLDDAIWQAYWAGDEKAFDTIFLHYLPMVAMVTNRFHFPPAVDKEDAMAEGAIGLQAAIKKFDNSKETPFGYYAVWIIRNYIMDSLRKKDWAPAPLRKQQRDISKAVKELAKNGEVTDEDIAAHLNITVEDLNFTRARIAQTYVESSDSLGDSDENFLNTKTAEEGSVEATIDRLYLADQFKNVTNIIRTRSLVEQAVIICYTVRGYTYKQITNEFGLTRPKTAALLKRVAHDIREDIKNSLEF